MIILAIETSCDDTAISIVEEKDNHLSVLANVVSSQIELHAAWGGVVPNLAAREHLKNILPLIELALKEAKITPADITLIAATRGPGLIPALLVGTTVAKTLAFVWQKPLLGVNHIEGHIYSNFVELNQKTQFAETRFPVLCLVVSGGHTQLVLMPDHLEYAIVGETLDDAAGEAFDKVARILGLAYPGGPIISKLATEFTPEILQKFPPINLPRPMLKSANLDFSFSGLKTAVLYFVKKNESLLADPDFIMAVCHEFQQAAIDVLVAKTITAAQKFGAQTIMIAGGVSANTALRQQLESAVKKNLPGANYKSPATGYSVDNAVMIAVAASYRWQRMTAEQKAELTHGWKKIDTNANLRLS